MTKQFDTLLEQMLSEMMPADIGEFGFGGAVKHVKGGVPEGEAKGHWAPLQKLSPEDRETVLSAIFKEVFSEKENTYAPTADNAEELRDAMQSAIQKVSGETAIKASGKWAAKFLADRLMTLLKGKVKYTTSAEGEELQKDVTQKEFKQALNKALEEVPAEAPSKEESPEEKEEEKTTETVYTKAADLETDDSDLQKAFNKLPEDKDMSWEEVLKTVGMTKGMALIDAGGLIETEKEVEEKEEEYGSDIKELDIEDDEAGGYEGEFERSMREIDPYFNTTRAPGGPLGWD